MSSQAVFATIEEADHWVFLTRSHELLDLTRRFLLDEPLEGLPYVAALEQFNRPAAAVPRPAPHRTISEDNRQASAQRSR
ncbi:hypothetical protein ABT224_33770 [Streptomyces sp. NPDC001584]|uniref:hypothetical protein n=1 Tax=Streptomyces sp. NPDC001584 TaxID=3154521 RepID=UPI003326BE63